MSKKNYPLVALIGTGALSLVHTASHIVPALGALGNVASSHSHSHVHEVAELGYLVSQNQSFYEHIDQVLSHPVLQVAYLAFVPLSFWYIIKDHRSHKKHEELHSEVTNLRTRNLELEKMLSVSSDISS